MQVWYLYERTVFFMLLNAALKEYLLECELRNYTEKTIKGYRNSIELLVNYLQQNEIRYPLLTDT